MPRPKSRLAPAIIVAGVLCALLAVYVLSVGPAMAMTAMGRFDGNVFDTIYWPIMALCGNWQWANDLLGWYANLCLELMG